MTGLLKAERQQKGHRTNTVALIMSALAIAASAGPSATPGLAAAGNNLADPVITASIEPARVPHELRIELTDQGAETLGLAARLKRSGGLINRPISWTVKRQEIGASLGSTVVYKTNKPAIDTPLEPGNYIIEASYGYHRVIHPVRIQPGQRIGVTLILNVGGIRAMSSIKNTVLPPSISAEHAVYATSGPLKGRRIVGNAGQGNVLRLAAGTYRVESRFTAGNTVAETRVTVKPGILSSMEMAHKAGLIRIIVGTDETAAVAWEIRSLQSSWSRSHTNPDASMVLAPGRYEVTAIVDGTSMTKTFSVKAGDLRHVKLGAE
ncbi:MAG: hypothetical protein OER56_09070 [Hyphomicrobiales bacterium]|nr:hypothetical protein [Hyphomicrobiales bacterium]